jgi:hypothetical protein
VPTMGCSFDLGARIDMPSLSAALVTATASGPPAPDSSKVWAILAGVGFIASLYIGAFEFDRDAVTV